MIIISDALERKNKDGETFISLIVSGGLEMCKSKDGKWYATTRKASVPCTLDLALAKQMIGTKMNGSIIKVPCEPYMYKTTTGEEIELAFNYQYTEEVATSLEESIFS